MEKKDLRKINLQLYEAVKTFPKDLQRIEELLKKGANPLAIVRYDYILSEAILHNFTYDEEVDDEDDRDYIIKDLGKTPLIVKMFFDYGMELDLNTCPISNHDGDNLPSNPLWLLPFVCDEDGINILKIFLDHGIDAKIIESEFVGHLIEDMAYVDGGPSEVGEKFEFDAIGLKEFMLVASYPYVFDQSEYMQEVLDIKNHDKSTLIQFRNWNDFEYMVDTSTATNLPYGLLESTVSVYRKADHEKVWEFQIW